MIFTDLKPLTKKRINIILEMIKRHPMSAHMVAQEMGFSSAAASNYLKMMHKNNLIYVDKWVQTNNGAPNATYGFGNLPDAERSSNSRPFKKQRVTHVPSSVKKPSSRSCDPLVAAFFYGVCV